MKKISVFDVIGPNMIGPSSSHTAGALKIAYLARKMAGSDIYKVIFTLYGSFANTYQGHGTDRALVGGILGFTAEDERIKDSFKLAEENGIVFSFQCDKEEKDVHPNTVDIEIEKENHETLTVRGISIGGGAVEIIEINEIAISFTGEYETLFIRQKDIPGMVAYITGKLGKDNINIANMSVYRTGKGEDAYTIVAVDNPVPERLRNEFLECPDILSVKMISL